MAARRVADVRVRPAFQEWPDGGKGLARDMRVRWALEEIGQPYGVRLVSMNALKEPAHLADPQRNSDASQCCATGGQGTQRRRHVTIDDARRAIVESAVFLAAGDPGPETQSLVAKLEKATGCGIGDLAVYADQWPEV